MNYFKNSFEQGDFSFIWLETGCVFHADILDRIASLRSEKF